MHPSPLPSLQPVLDYSKFRDADMAIEAVIESIPLKQKIFADLDQACRPDCVLATNTSTIDITLVGQKIRDPTRIVGAHFFSPAHIMPLLEIVRAPDTPPQVTTRAAHGDRHTGASACVVVVTDDVKEHGMGTVTQLQTGMRTVPPLACDPDRIVTVSTLLPVQVVLEVMEMASKIHKTPVVVGNCTGFAVNRVFFPYTMAACMLVDAGEGEMGGVLCACWSTRVRWKQGVVHDMTRHTIPSHCPAWPIHLHPIPTLAPTASRAPHSPPSPQAWTHGRWTRPCGASACPWAPSASVTWWGGTSDCTWRRATWGHSPTASTRGRSSLS